MKIAVGLIGLGRIGSLLEKDKLREKPATHAGAIFNHPECQLVAACDKDPEKQQLFEKQWNFSSFYSDYKEMLEKEKIDILFIATPTSTHYSILSFALQKKVPVIVCEKPLTQNIEEAKKIKKLYQNSSSIVLINHERRYSKNYQYIQKIIQNQKYGILRSLSAKLYFGNNKTPAEILWHDGTHLIDIIGFLIGDEWKIIQCFGKPYQKKATLFVFAKIGSTPAFLEIGAGRDHLVFEIDFSFERGRVRIGNGLLEECESKESPYYENFRSLLPVFDYQEKDTGYFTNMVIDAVSVFKNPGQKPLSSLEDGYKTLLIMDKILKKSGR